MPQGQKHPPPSGFTGHYNTGPPSAEQIQEWRRERGEDGIGFVLQDGWLLIDVDNYAKGEWPEGTGAATIAAAGERAGCGLPAGPKLRNRTDGSEKRLFWVPPGLKFRKSLGPCVDLVTPTHRYVNVGINPDTGRPDQCFDADDSPLGAPPPIEDQRKLPDAWLRLVVQDSSEATPMATEEQAQAWLDDMPRGPMGALVREAVADAVGALGGERGSRHDRMQEQIRYLVEMGAAGLAGVPAALAFLRARFAETTAPDREGGKREAEAEFDSFVRWGARVCRPEAFSTLRRLENTGFDGWLAGVQITGGAPSAASRFRLVSAQELAEPIAPMRWLIRGIWPERSAGVLGGDKKAFKTWNLQAIALAVASGYALFDEYPVPSSGPVLYLCGEGGQSTFAQRHQVIAERYTIPRDVLRGLPLGVDFGVGSLTERDFIEAVKRHLDELQPKLVILDPLYAYHPSDVEAQNIYARGPMLANLRTLIGDGAALIVGDHFNKTAGRGLDLDNIAQAGMSAWADSWILQKHREAPDLEIGKFLLDVQTGTRRGGGKHLEVDWTLKRDASDPDAIVWTGVDWESRPSNGKGAAGQMDKTAEHILQVVRDNPFELTETKVVETVGGNRQKTREVLQGLKVNGLLVIRNCEGNEAGRTVNRDRVGLGEGRNGFGGGGRGSELVPDEGTGSERVES